MAHRDNGGPATGVGFAGGLGLRLQECNLWCVENGPSHEGSPFDCRRGWSFKGASRLRLPFDKKNQNQRKGKKNTVRLWPLPRILWELAW